MWKKKNGFNPTVNLSNLSVIWAVYNFLDGINPFGFGYYLDEQLAQKYRFLFIYLILIPSSPRGVKQLQCLQSTVHRLVLKIMM